MGEDPHLNFSKGKTPKLPTQIKPKMIIMLRWVKMLFMCKLQLLDGLNRLDYGIMESWNHGIMESWNHGIMESWNHGIMEFWTLDSGFWIFKAARIKQLSPLVCKICHRLFLIQLLL